METIEDRICKLAGVKPCEEWIKACRKHLHSNFPHRNEAEEDTILYQILNSDLRHVVRRFDEAVDYNESDIEMNPGLELRLAISQSMPKQKGNNDNIIPHKCKVELKETFRHLVQIEEILDVSQNAENRLKFGPSSSSPTPVGNQKTRCLKMVIADGCFPNGFVQEKHVIGGLPSVEVAHMVAMEIQPIPDLSVHSLAGVKVFLRGPISVRLGIIMLHEGNAMVLGGCIPELVPIQKKANQMAKRVAGVGVDPTVKALIWNPHTGMEEDDDEGEQESSDVLVPQNPRQDSLLNTSNFISNEHAPSDAIIRNQRCNGSIPNRFPNSNPQNSDETFRRQERSAQQSQSLKNAYINTTHQQPQIMEIEQPFTNLDNKQSSNFPARVTKEKPGTAYNPYAKPTNSKISSAKKRTDTIATLGSTREGRAISPSYRLQEKKVQSTTENPYKSKCQKPQVQVIGEPERDLTPIDLSSSNSIPSNKKTERENTFSTLSSEQKRTDHHTVIPTSPSEQDIGNDDIIPRKKLFPTPKNISLVPSPPLLPLPVSFTELPDPISFLEMRSILEKIISLSGTDAYALYNLNESKTFVVPCKIHIDHTNYWGFNIEKLRKTKKKSKLSTTKVDKYGYVMMCRLTGPNEKDGQITCKLSNAFLTELFKIPAGELRKLNREDKEKCNELVNEGGTSVLNHLEALGSVHMKFLYSSNEFFSSSSVSPFGDSKPQIDGDIPILSLEKEGE